MADTSESSAMQTDIIEEVSATDSKREEPVREKRRDSRDRERDGGDKRRADRVNT